uniref:Uncharacterized protein n=1 Tax=Lygus hesperus TaxID=30085 RepID=A0A0A9YNA8_LYGHE
MQPQQQRPGLLSIQGICLEYFLLPAIPEVCSCCHSQHGLPRWDHSTHHFRPLEADAVGDGWRLLSLYSSSGVVHLNFSSLNHCAMESLACCVCIVAICESYKTEPTLSFFEFLENLGGKRAKTNPCSKLSTLFGT